MNSTVRFMFATAATVLLPLYPAFSAQAVQDAQQDSSLEGRIAQLQRNVRQDPKNPDLHFDLSKLYEEDIEKYYDGALSEFGLAVDNGLKGKTVIWNPLGTEFVNIGSALVKSGKYDEGIKNFERAAVFNLNYPLLNSSFAAAYKEKGEYDEAIEYMGKAIDLNPSKASFYESIGRIYLNNKDFRLSLLNLNKSIYLDFSSENKVLFYSIAKAYHGLGQYNDAIGALDKLPRKWKKDEIVKELRQECVDELLKQSR